MPELPEVETVVRDLRPHLTGKRIMSLIVSKQALRKPWLARWRGQLLAKTVLGVERRGKWIIVHLEEGRYLVLHLGMSGQLTVVEADAPLANHTHLIFGLNDNRQLRFRDIRRFGSATLFADADAMEKFFTASKLGPEPFALDATYWKQRLQATDRCLKAILLDQRIVAGVGNIYADESLFQAKLHPARLGRDLDSAEATRLRHAVVTVLQRAIERRGSSISDFVGGCGHQGAYQHEFRALRADRQSVPALRHADRTHSPRGTFDAFLPHLSAAG